VTLEHYTTADLVDGAPDGTHPLDHLWLTAPWRVDGMPPIVRVERYAKDRAVIAGIHPSQGIFTTRNVVLASLQWCGSSVTVLDANGNCPGQVHQ
jgi:hypothetical protein